MVVTNKIFKILKDLAADEYDYIIIDEVKGHTSPSAVREGILTPSYDIYIIKHLINKKTEHLGEEPKRSHDKEVFIIEDLEGIIFSEQKGLDSNLKQASKSLPNGTRYFLCVDVDQILDVEAFDRLNKSIDKEQAYEIFRIVKMKESFPLKPLKNEVGPPSITNLRYIINNHNKLKLDSLDWRSIAKEISYYIKDPDYDDFRNDVSNLNGELVSKCTNTIVNMYIISTNNENLDNKFRDWIRNYRKKFYESYIKGNMKYIKPALELLMKGVSNFSYYKSDEYRSALVYEVNNVISNIKDDQYRNKISNINETLISNLLNPALKRIGDKVIIGEQKQLFE